ncbi:hypothetical protein ACHAXN_009790 [Cyclotella atomus]
MKTILCRHAHSQHYNCCKVHRFQHVSSSSSADDMSARQRALYDEATSITRALYRRCLESIRVLAKGNDNDEMEFAAREKSELSKFDELSDSKSPSTASLLSPPVNRTNELSSRAYYYSSFCRENFEGHWNLLGVHGFHIDKKVHGLGHIVGGQANNQYQGGHHHLGGQIASQYVGQYAAVTSDHEQNKSHYTWNEGQIQQFVYLIRSGEEKRAWILQDYKFGDPCVGNGWPKELEERLERFEVDANSLVKEIYKQKGWMHSSDIANPVESEDDSDDEEDL